LDEYREKPFTTKLIEDTLSNMLVKKDRIVVLPLSGKRRIYLI
jgi:hypothetical protein